MSITIKNICSLVIVNLIVFAVAGCASTPAPWVQADTKQVAEEINVPAEIDLSGASLNDPALLADPEPETIVMERPAAAPVPEVIVPVVLEQQTPEQEIMALPTTSFAVQIYAANTLRSIEKFKNKKDLAELKTVKTERSGSIVYVLVDIYPDRRSANLAAADLQARTGLKSWVRSVAGLQKITVQ